MEKKVLFSQAVAFAAAKHANQTRSDGTPYIYHPLKVAELVKNTGFDLDYQIAAVLHDILEDTDTTEEELQRFGDNVVEAVKLLTRPSGLAEEMYVSKILDNHMAAVVKNADKIHNIFDATHAEDKVWAENYINKSKKYYLSKFSPALDSLLETKTPTEHLNIESPKMILYSDRKKSHYLHCKELYNTCDVQPDFTNPSMKYWYDEFIDFYFCYITTDLIWSLSNSGWLPMSYNPFWEDEYGDYLYPRTREQVLSFIEKMKQENYFYDFVELEKL